MTSPTHYPRHLWPAWGFSFSIHAIVMGIAISLLHDLPKPQPPVLRMEFLLTAPKSVADTASSQETVTELPSPAMPSSPRVMEQRTPTDPSIVQQMVRSVTPAAVPQRDMNQSSTASDSARVARPVPIEQQIETRPPVEEFRKPATMNTAQAIERPAPAASTHDTASPAAEPIIKRSQDGMSQASLAASENAQDTTEIAKSPVSDSINSPASAPIDHTSSSQPTSQSSAIAPHPETPTGSSSSPMSHMDSNSPAITPQSTVVMNHPAITRTMSTKPDYGWLNELLKRRIMSLQAYPRLARMQGWEGVVVVKARIKSDGSLLNAVVTESSGYASLDEDALKLMQRACPIQLQQDLGQSQIDVWIPVHYRLER